MTPLPDDVVATLRASYRARAAGFVRWTIGAAVIGGVLVVIGLASSMWPLSVFAAVLFGAIALSSDRSARRYRDPSSSVVLAALVDEPHRVVTIMRGTDRLFVRLESRHWEVFYLDKSEVVRIFNLLADRSPTARLEPAATVPQARVVRP